MSRAGGFNRTFKFGVAFTDVILYHFSFIITFLIRYNGERPTFNYSAYHSALPYIMIAFILLNTFSFLYTLYNNRFIDMFSTTLISQVMMSVVVTAMTFYGRWFAFPRTIIFLNLFVSTIILFIWRVIVLETYIKRSGTSKVMVI